MLFKNGFWRGGYRLFHESDKIQCNSRQFRFFKKCAVNNSRSLKVAVLGAAGNIGRSLSFFLKQSVIIDELAIYDIQSIQGLAIELSHIDTRCKINVCESDDPSLEEVLDDAKVVMVTAGKPYTTKNPSFQIIQANAEILSELIPNIVKYCPNAMVAIATDPLDSLIPFASEIFKMAGMPNLNRLFGITTLHCMRANTFTAQVLDVNPECVIVPVVGGNTCDTCIPLFSQAKPCNSFTHEEVSRLTLAVRNAEQNFHSRYPSEKPQLRVSMGYAAARFCISLCKALRDEPGVVECAYVRSCAVPNLTYFATPLKLGSAGIQKHLGVPPLSDSESKLVEIAIPILRKSIRRGQILAHGSDSCSTESCPVEPEPCAEKVYPLADRQCCSPTLLPKSCND